jgi:hypothetical protein
MKTNGKHEVIAHIVRRGLLPVALLAIALTCATADRAQSSATTAPTQDAKSATPPATIAHPQTPAEKPAALSNEVPSSQEEKPSAKGAHEGITVHGHWIIDVKNPDGSLTEHREFENDLITGVDGSGQQTLASLLLGYFVPESWEIALLGNPAPCANQVNSTVPSGSFVAPGCYLLQLGSTPSQRFNGELVGGCPAQGVATTGTGCFSTVTVTPVAQFLLPNALTLQGTALVGQPSSSITQVVTSLNMCTLGPGKLGQANVAPSTCFGNLSASNYPSPLTSKTLASAITNLTVGQIISVTVQFSFN